MQRAVRSARMPRCPTCHRRLAAAAVCPEDGARAPDRARVDDPAPAIPGYSLRRALGAGGFATVWAARAADGGEAAVKVSRAATTASRQRFAREAEALRRAGPACAPALIEAGDAGGLPFLVMEKLAGASLAHRMARWRRPLPLARAVRLGQAVVAALGAAHARGVAHGDLTPENIQVEDARAPRVRLVDFGLATTAGAGTLEYMAPERWRGAAAEPASDVYALGAVLYELLALRPPFRGDAAAIQFGHLALRAPELAVPAELARLVDACLAKQPEARPRDLAALAGELGEASRARARRAPSAASDGGAMRVPAALLAAVGDGSPVAIAEAAARRGGFVARQRGGGAVMVFLAGDAGDPIDAACAVARELRGARALVHVGHLDVRWRDRGPPLVHGEELDRLDALAGAGLPGDQQVLASAAAAAALPAGTARAIAGSDLVAVEPQRELRDAGPLLGRERELAAIAASRPDGAPSLLTIVGDHGLGKSRLAAEVAALAGGARAVAVRAPTGPVDHAALADADVLIVDDADRASAAWLDAIERAALDGERARWIVALAHPRLRALRPRWGEAAARTAWLELGPLPEPAAVALAERLLSPAEYVPAAALRALVDRADCVPRHIVDVADALRRQGVIRRRGDRWYLATEELERVPRAPVTEWMAARAVDELPAPLGALLGVCAVLAAPFSADEVEAVQAEVDHARARADTGVGLLQLASRGLLARDAGGWRFRREAVRAGVEALLPRARRAAIHATALRYWRAQPAGPHALAAIARHAGAREAADAHLVLGADALRVHAAVDAERHFDAALALLDDELARAHALVGRARARYRMDRAADAIADLRAAAELAGARGDAGLHALARVEEAIALDWCDELAASAARVDEAAALAACLDDPRLDAALATGRGRTAWRRGQVADAIEWLQRGAEGAAACGDHDTRAIALVLLAPALVTAGELARAEARFDEVIALCERAGDRFHLCAAYNNRMFLWSARRDLQRARADLRRARALARELGHPMPERRATYNLAEDLFWSGDTDEALALAQRSRALQQRFIAKPVAEDALLVARIALWRGDAALARRELAWIDEHVPEAEQSASVRLLRRCLRLVLAGAPPAAWDPLVAAARAALEPGEVDEVLQWLGRANDDPGHHSAVK